MGIDIKWNLVVKKLNSNKGEKCLSTCSLCETNSKIFSFEYLAFWAYTLTDFQNDNKNPFQKVVLMVKLNFFKKTKWIYRAKNTRFPHSLMTITLVILSSHTALRFTTSKTNERIKTRVFAETFLTFRKNAWNVQLLCCVSIFWIKFSCSFLFLDYNFSF